MGRTYKIVIEESNDDFKTCFKFTGYVYNMDVHHIIPTRNLESYDYFKIIKIATTKLIVNTDPYNN